MEDRKDDIFRLFLYLIRKERDEYVVPQEQKNKIYEAIRRKMASK